jgi:hypothetical protein
MDDATALKALESVADQAVRMVGSGIEMFGVLIIVAGIAWSTYLHLRRPMPGGIPKYTKSALADHFCLASRSWLPPIS